MALIQTIYILILNSTFKVTGKINENIRNIIILIMLFIQGTLFFVWQSFSFFKIDISQNEKAIIGCVLLFFVVIVSVKEPLHKVRWNPWFTGIWYMCSLLIILASFDHISGDGIRSLGLVMLIAFPCFNFVWNNRKDYDVLFELIAKAFVAVLILYFIICIFVAPLEVTGKFGDRYAATTHNPNRLGMLSVVTASCSIYLYTSKKPHCWMYMLPFGLSISLTYFSMSRTSLLAIIVQFLAFTIFSISNNVSLCASKSKIIVKLIGLIIFSIACIPLANFVLTAGHSTIVSIKEKQVYVYAQERNAQNSGDGKDQNRLDSFENRLSLENKDINSLSSGRIEIWKYYLRNMNLRGHSMMEPTVKVNGVAFYGAHNTPIDIGYRCGILAGILYLLIEITAWSYTLKFNLKKSKQYQTTYNGFVVLTVTSFCVISMLEIAIFPFDNAVVFLFLCASAPLFEKKKGIKQAIKQGKHRKSYSLR